MERMNDFEWNRAQHLIAAGEHSGLYFVRYEEARRLIWIMRDNQGGRWMRGLGCPTLAMARAEIERVRENRQALADINGRTK